MLKRLLSAVCAAAPFFLLSDSTQSLIPAITRILESTAMKQLPAEADEAVIIDFVYDRLPAKYKAPTGTIARDELTRFIGQSIALYRTGKALLR